MDVQLVIKTHEAAARCSSLLLLHGSVARWEELPQAQRKEVVFLYRQIHELWGIMDRNGCGDAFERENTDMERFVTWFVEIAPHEDQ